jgi:hypothetical protein
VRQTFRSTNGIRAKTRKIFVLAICCELCVAQNELVGGFPRIVSEAVRPVLVCNGFGHHVPHVVKNCMTQEVARLPRLRRLPARLKGTHQSAKLYGPNPAARGRGALPAVLETGKRKPAAQGWLLRLSFRSRENSSGGIGRRSSRHALPCF